MIHLYRCVVKYGHVGSGKYLERKIYVHAKNTTEALTKVKHFRGVKKGNLLKNGASVLAIVQEA